MLPVVHSMVSRKCRKTQYNDFFPLMLSFDILNKTNEHFGILCIYLIKSSSKQ